MDLVLVTGPASEPISLYELKLHARVEYTDIDEDILFNDIIKAAREHVENITRRALFTQTWAYYLDDWPSGDRIRLPLGNLQITSLAVTYDEVDADNNKSTETLTLTTDYLIETNGDQCGYIVLPYGDTWPSFTHWPTHSIKIQYQCGWTAVASIPFEIKTAIKLIALDLYANRESQVMSNLNYQENKTVMRLLQSQRLWDEF